MVRLNDIVEYIPSNAGLPLVLAKVTEVDEEGYANLRQITRHPIHPVGSEYIYIEPDEMTVKFAGMSDLLAAVEAAIWENDRKELL